MKKILTIILVALLVVGCQQREESYEKPDNRVLIIDDDSKHLPAINWTQKTLLSAERRKPKPTSPGGGGVVQPPSNPLMIKGMVLLVVNGDSVKNTPWNVYGPMYMTPANIPWEEAVQLKDSVQARFNTFQSGIIVTLDPNEYYAFNAYRRTRCIITENNGWYGSTAGGVAYIGSFTWGDNTPCFVFSKLLGYSFKHLMEAATHEIGHTLSLRHQKCPDGSCEYWDGGNEAWAPIMGVGYYKRWVRWIIGTTIAGEQNDTSKMKSYIQ